MNKSAQRIIYGVVLIGLVVATVILILNSKLSYLDSLDNPVNQESSKISPEEIKNTDSDNLLIEIETDMDALEKEYDFSADIDSELLLVPDFDSELTD